MSRRSLSILFVLLAAIAIGAVWFAGGFGNSTKETQESAGRARDDTDARSDPSTELVDLPTGAPPQVLPVEPEPSTPQRTGAAATESDRELAEATWIEGRVIIPRGTPPDEQVVIIAEGLPFESRGLHRVSPGADGTFRVAFSRETRLGVLQLAGKYLYLKTYHAITLPPKASSEIVLRPKLGGCIRGRVLLPLSGNTSQPSVVGSSVTVFENSEGDDLQPSKQNSLASAKLDETLQFELRGVPNVDNTFLGLRSRDAWHADPVAVKVRPGQVSTADILVEASATIRGIVLDPDGKPRVRASVSIRRANKPKSPVDSAHPDADDTTDSEGLYELRGLAAGAYEVWADASNVVSSAPTKLELVPGQVVTDLTLRLSRGGRIVGEVLDAADVPEPRVYVHTSSSGGQRSKTTQTDSKGRFEIGELAPGEYVVKTGWPGDGWRPGHSLGASSREAIVQVEDGQTVQVVIGWNREQNIEVQGTVRFAGEPAAGWRVSATPTASMNDERRSTTSETDGSYRLGLHRAGWFTFEVESPEGTTNRSESVQLPFAKTLQKNFDLLGRGRIAGRVVDGNGAAVESVVVRVAAGGEFHRFAGQAFVGEGTTDALGAFAFEGVPEGSYRLEADSPFGRGSLQGIRLDEGEAVEGLALTIQESCNLEVSLRRADGKPVPDASVGAIGQGSYSASWSMSSSTQIASRHVLRGLRPGEVTVTANSDDPPLAGSATVVLAPGEKGKVEIVLKTATVLLVRIGAAGRDLRDVVVGVRYQRGAAVGCEIDSSLGAPEGWNASERRFGSVSSGRYTVFAEHPDGSKAQSEIEIAGESEHIVLLSLQP